MADRRYHVASLLIGVVVWTGENDTKTISVDAKRFENGTKQLRFRLKRISVDWALETTVHVVFGGRQRNVQRFVTHVHSHCSAH